MTIQRSRLVFPNTSINQIWKDNSLDFKAEKKLFYQDQNNVLQEVTDYQTIINNNTDALNIPKNDYTILQLDKIKNVIQSCEES